MQVDIDALVEQNKGVVMLLVRNLIVNYGTMDMFEDLVGYGMVALCEAARRYDPCRGVAFSSFAWPRIKGQILEGMCKLKGVTRKKKARAAAEAAATKVLAEAVEARRSMRGVREEYDELAELVAEAGAVYITSFRFEPVDTGGDPESWMSNKETAELLDKAMAELTDEEAWIIRMYYTAEMRLEDMAEYLGHSKSWIWKIHGRAIKKIRRRLACKLEGSC